jgi:bifunctional non-homologous end joining protein LigD
MAARIDNGRVQLLTRTGLEWTAKYPSAIAALVNLNVTAYLDGELCGVDEGAIHPQRAWRRIFWGGVFQAQDSAPSAGIR